MTDFFNQVGKAVVGNSLRLLSEKILSDAEEIYELYGISLRPKWFPVFYVLLQGENNITGIAGMIGQSHVSVVKIASEMLEDGIVLEKRDKRDARKNVVELTAKGREMGDRIRVQCADMTAAIEGIMKATRHDLWEAIREWDSALEEKSLVRWVEEEKRKREKKN